MLLLITKLCHKQRGTSVVKSNAAAGRTDTCAEQKCQVAFGDCVTVTKLVSHINQDTRIWGQCDYVGRNMKRADMPVIRFFCCFDCREHHGALSEVNYSTVFIHKKSMPRMRSQEH